MFTLENRRGDLLALVLQLLALQIGLQGAAMGVGEAIDQGHPPQFPTPNRAKVGFAVHPPPAPAVNAAAIIVQLLLPCVALTAPLDEVI